MDRKRKNQWTSQVCGRMARRPRAPALAQRAASSLTRATKELTDGRASLKMQSLRCFQGSRRETLVHWLRRALSRSQPPVRKNRWLSDGSTTGPRPPRYVRTLISQKYLIASILHRVHLNVATITCMFHKVIQAMLELQSSINEEK